MNIITNAFSLNMLAHFDVDIICGPLNRGEVARLAHSYESAVGHADTAALFSNVLGVPIEHARKTVSLSPGDTVVVGQYRGPRLPEGVIELPPNAEIVWVSLVIRSPQPHKEE